MSLPAMLLDAVQELAAAAKRFWYARIVLRSMPVARSISRWLAPASSKVQTVVCKCGFKTFTSVALL